MDAEARKESDLQINALLAQLGAPAQDEQKPAASSVDWLRRYLPAAVGDYLKQREQQALQPTSAREIAGDVISTAGNIMPAGRFAAPRPTGIRAYHGSPYDFDRFDMSRIGTGEGAQSYGHGLYFAENPSVAESYKKPFGPGGKQWVQPTFIDNMPADQWLRVATRSPAEKHAGDALARMPNIDHAIEYLAQDNNAAANAARQWLSENRGRITEPGGKMYEVNINADPSQFLDWNKPLGQQAPEIREALSRYSLAPERHGVGALAEIGRQANQNTAYPAGTIGRGNAETIAASAALRDAGIPGIRYLDQWSRFSTNEGELNALKEQLARSRTNPNAAALFPPHELEAQIAKLEAQPKPTSNYVLFRDDIIAILRKYGLLGGMVGGAAASGQDEPLPFSPR